MSFFKKKIFKNVKIFFNIPNISLNFYHSNKRNQIPNISKMVSTCHVGTNLDPLQSSAADYLIKFTNLYLLLCLQPL